MDLFQKIGIALIMLLWGTTLNAQISTVEITAQTTSHTVDYILHNSGDSPLSLNYIIIQDEVLMLEQGEFVLEAGGTSLISVSVECTNNHVYELDLNETVLPKD